MVYYTGDIHGETSWIVRFCKKFKLTRKDIVVILGDVCVNYFGNDRDDTAKIILSSVKPTVLCIHGNHENRPQNIPTYKTMEWNGGTVWYEEKYPNLLFAKDGEIYTMDGLRHIAIGGAYSIDMYQRIFYRQPWWDDEQPSDEIKRYVEQQLKDNKVDVILSHTCPAKYEPKEAYLSGYDQKDIDKSTEEWLDRIEETTDYIAWYCGHWHINKRIDNIHFLAHNFESSEHLREIVKMKEKTVQEIGISIGNYNILTTFAVRYALDQKTLAASTMKRIILESVDILHEQTKHGIIRDIEDYIEQNESVFDLMTWEQLKDELLQDIQRRRKNG